MATAPSEFSTRLFEAIDDLDADRYVEFLAEDVVVHFANDRPIHGRQAVREMLDDHLAGVARMHHRVVDEFSDGDALIQQLEVTMVRTNGASGTVPAVNVLRFRDDGLIRDYRVVIDTTPIDAAVPSVPAWTDPAELEPRQVIAAFAEAINTRDDEAIEKLVADDYLQHTQTIPDGRSSLKGYHRALFERWPDLYVELSNLLQDGDYVSAFSRIVMSDSLEVNTANVWLIRNGQLAEHWEVADASGSIEELTEAR